MPPAFIFLIHLGIHATMHETFAVAGVVLGVVAAFGLIAASIFGVRYKVAYQAENAAAESLRESLDDERGRVKRQEEALSSVRDQLKHANDTVARLEALPDLARIVKILDAHELRAQERHEKTASVLTALVERVETSGHALTALVESTSREGVK